MTQRAAEIIAYASGAHVDCKREHVGRSHTKRKVTYRVLSNTGTVLGESPEGWKDALTKGGFKCTPSL